MPQRGNDPRFPPYQRGVIAFILQGQYYHLKLGLFVKVFVVLLICDSILKFVLPVILKFRLKLVTPLLYENVCEKLPRLEEGVSDRSLIVSFDPIFEANCETLFEVLNDVCAIT